MKKDIYASKNELFNKFVQTKHCVATGIGNKVIDGEDIGVECLKLYVSKKKAKNQIKGSDLLPESYNGLLVDVIEMGYPTYQGTSPGADISRGSACPGGSTMGLKVRRKGTNTEFILATRHQMNPIGGDVRWCNNHVATVSEVLNAPIGDAAIAEITPSGSAYVSPVHVSYGPVSIYYTSAVVGLQLKKYGMGSGHTLGRVTDRAWTGPVSGTTYTDQIKVDGDGMDWSVGGDSGAMAFANTYHNYSVGLHFAGFGSGDDGIGILTPMVYILNHFNLEIVRS